MRSSKYSSNKCEEFCHFVGISAHKPTLTKAQTLCTIWPFFALCSKLVLQLQLLSLLLLLSRCCRRSAKRLHIERLHCYLRWFFDCCWMLTVFYYCYLFFLFLHYCGSYVSAVGIWHADGRFSRWWKFKGHIRVHMYIHMCTYALVGRGCCVIQQLFAVAQLLIFLFISVICFRHLQAQMVRNPFTDNWLQVFSF